MKGSKKSKKQSAAREQAQSTEAQPPQGGILKRFPIVGVGASAGGLEAFTELLKHLPVDSGMGFVLVQHLDPLHESALTQLLKRATSMPVSEVTNDLPVEPNHIYVIAPNTSLAIARGILKLQPRRPMPGGHRSIDVFFESLAQDQRECAIGVILSGTASDGTMGLEAIKAEGGTTFVQDESAKYDSMPRSAVAAGCVDFVLPPEKIAKELTRIARHPYVLAGSRPAEAAEEAGLRRDEARAADDDGEDHKLRKILLLLRNHSNVDFTLYKSGTIQRRINHRIMLNKLTTLDEYAQFLRGNAKEREALYSDVLINVTGFFRNPEAFEILKRAVFPKLIPERREDPLRVWVLGCSTGQEVYSMAMLFTEFSDRRRQAPKLQIFATDLNDVLLEKARAGFYAKTLMQDVAPERLRRFFVAEDGGYRICKPLRDIVVFARHNLLNDPPFTRMDLISCRNVMIYLEPGLQKKVLPTFHYALKPKGILFLGGAESIGSFTDLFAPLDKKHRIYEKKSGPASGAHVQLGPLLPAVRKEAIPLKGVGPRGEVPIEVNVQREADRVTLKRYAPAGVFINADLHVLQVRGDTSPYLKLPTGQVSLSVLKMAREGLMLPLRAALNKAKKENRVVRKENVRVNQNGQSRTVNLEIIPLKSLKERYYLVFFEEPGVGRGAPSEVTIERSGGKTALPTAAARRRIAELEDELADTRDYLQSIQEQYEASHEEVQASNEEVTSANEELQSINEELETSKEELESTNEELTTVNEEMGHRNDELSRLNSDLMNLQSSAHLPIILLGRNLTIRRFTSQAEKQFNLRDTDVGQSISRVRHNLDLPDLEEVIIKVIETVREDEREVRDKEGRWYSLRVRPYLTLDNKVDGAVLVLMDIDALKRTESVITDARNYADAIIRTVRDPLVILTEDLHVHSANEAFHRTFKVAPAVTDGFLIYELGNGQWNIPRLCELLEGVIPRNAFFDDFEVTHDFEQIGRRTFLINARPLRNRNDERKLILMGIQDITDRKLFEALRESEERYRMLAESLPELVWTCTAEGQCDYVNSRWSEYTGLPREQLFGEGWKQTVNPVDRERIQNRWVEAIKNGVAHELEYRINRANNEYRWFKARFVPLRDRKNRIIKWFCTCSDIQEETQAREKLERTVEERTAALREAVGELETFSYSIAHDLRAPLRAMKGFAQILHESYSSQLDETGRNYLERISKAGARLDVLIQDVLNYTQVARARPPLTRVDLDRLVRGMIESYPHLQPPVADIQIEDTLPPVLAHEAFLTQSISNLLSNAVKFVAKRVKPQVKLWTESNGPTVRINFKDNGIGIAAADSHRIFRMFERLRPTSEYEGTGIGLTIVRKAVEHMGGRVGFESEPGNGSNFWIELKKADG